MLRFLRTFTLVSAMAGLAGCAAMSTDDPYPVTDNSPNPAPVRGYRVQCQTGPTIPNIFGESSVTGCQQIIPPEPVLVRARG